ncbi:hypothetical protein [Neochlamydia sp. S13]|uniref:hypothetical protein n=1 Tax=Neochlamydia sp. S13 TaxID=1353976 RepID=UPI0005A885B7|nr:hypothetical protein [Neochlamydia sp. S13]BBI17339.1 hypothetical protein NCS13_1_1144 [Neochlamydia sp. S13]
MRKFCRKLLKQIKHFRAYLKDLALPMIPNAVEESLRNPAMVCKVCLDSQSTYGKRWKKVLLCSIATLYRQGKFMLDFLVNVISAVRTKQPIPSII